MSVMPAFLARLAISSTLPGVVEMDKRTPIPAGSLSNMVSFAVPARFRLVIEYVSGSARVGDKELARVNVAMSASGTCGPTPGCPIV